jgi:hypothetical protein
MTLESKKYDELVFSFKEGHTQIEDKKEAGNQEEWDG